MPTNAVDAIVSTGPQFVRPERNMTLITIDELAVRLLTTKNALHIRMHRNPFAVPPRVTIPGDKRILFDTETVEKWLSNPTVSMPQPKRGPGRPRKSV